MELRHDALIGVARHSQLPLIRASYESFKRDDVNLVRAYEESLQAPTRVEVAQRPTLAAEH